MSARQQPLSEGDVTKLRRILGERDFVLVLTALRRSVELWDSLKGSCGPESYENTKAMEKDYRDLYEALRSLGKGGESC